MNLSAEGGSYPRPGSVLRPGLLSILLSAALAGAVFSILPFFGILSAQRHEETLRLLPAPSVIPAPPAPRHVQPRTVSETRPKRRAKPRRLSDLESRPRQPIETLQAQLSLVMTSLRLDVGDFSLDFEVEQPEAAPETTEQPAPQVFETAELDSPLRPIVCTSPAYPPRARRKGIEGFVELVFTVTSEGAVTDIEIGRSEPGATFVSAAKAAVSRWRFSPPQRNGRPVTALARQVIKFQLDKK